MLVSLVNRKLAQCGMKTIRTAADPLSSLPDHRRTAGVVVCDKVECVLAQRLDVLLTAGVLPDIKRLNEEFVLQQTAVPLGTVNMPLASRYDALLMPIERTQRLETASI